ncbi:MAG: LysM peptidoglycan-binding domain-containing protein [Candidatus Dojkabacteria bacterium]
MAKSTSSRVGRTPRKKIQEEYEEVVTYRLRPQAARLGIAVILIGLGVVFLSSGLLDGIDIAVFNSSQSETAQDDNEGSRSIDTDDKVDGDDKSNSGENKGKHISGGISTERVDASTGESAKKAHLTAKSIDTSGRWRATDYVQGDIGLGVYTVKRGDTLWEISEAVYGSGFKWRKLLRVNRDEIGFLPNRSQALIVPGQKLVIKK